MTIDVRSDVNCVSGRECPVSSITVSGFERKRRSAENAHCQTQESSVLGLESCSRKEIRRILRKNWKDLKRQFEFIARHAPKDKLVEAITIFSESRKSRFLRRRTPKYGSLNKGFEEDEIRKFFSVIDDQRLHLLYSYQAVLGLRIGEAVKVHVKEINLKTRELRIETEKAGTLDVLLIPQELFNATLEYIRNFETEIVSAGGYLFFVKDGHMSISFARQKFHKYIRKAGLHEVYGYSNDSRPRALARLSTHSLRHYAITKHARSNNGNVVLTNKFARHLRLQTTMTYIYTSKDELYKSIEKAQDGELLERIRRMQNSS